jgi:hypothetical protein
MNELKTLTFKQAEEIARHFCFYELQVPMNQDGYSFIITDVFENGFTYIRTTEYMQCNGIFELIGTNTTQYAEVVTRRFKEETK